MFTRIFCRLRRIVRRSSWWYLFAIGLFLYPALQAALVRLAVQDVASADVAGAAVAAAAKMVDWVQVYSKFAVGVGVFCFINLLGFASLSVVPVLPTWAQGGYAKGYQPGKGGVVSGLQALPGGHFPPQRPVVIPGFKGTFLQRLDDTQRMKVYLVVWALELAVAGLSVWAAFTIQ